MMKRNEVTRPLLGALIALIATGGALLATRTPAPPPPPLEPGDTVVVYGPQTFSTTSGSLQHHLERFELTSVPGQKFLLKVDNGLPDGSKRVGGGAVVLNGSTILTSAQLAAGGAGWTNQIQELTEDTLQVSVSGDAGDEVTVSVLATVSGTFNIFGLERFTRLNGTPATDERTFTLPASAGAPYTMCLVNGNADGSNRIASAQIKLNGSEIIGSSDLSKQVAGLMRPVTPTSGTNTLSVKLTAQPSGFVDLCVMATDVGDPVLTITAPAPGFVTRDSAVQVTGTVTDATATQVEVNGLTATLGSGNSWSVDVPLVEGLNTLAVTATDAAGNTTDSTRVVYRDLTPPDVMITTPAVDGLTADSVITLAGTAFDDHAFTLNVNGTPISVDSLGNWSTQVAVPNVVNLYVVTATDAAGNATSAIRVMGRDNQAPTLTVTTPEQNDTTEASAVTVTGTVVDSSAVIVTVNGDTVAVTGGAFEHMVELLVGPNTVLVIATDAFGNVSTVSRTVVREEAGGGLPPEPETVAPALDSTVATNLFASTEFLWSGANPIQTGVAPGTIVPKRLTVVRGKVLNRDANPLSGATVRVLNHPEYGETKSRATGLYDIALNGGGPVTVEVEKAGYFSVQRTLAAQWQQWTTLDSIVLTPMDTNVTTIDFSDSVEVARGSVVSDSAGTRRGTLLFRQGTVTTVVLPNASIDTLPSINVRITEYTTGPLGLEAMPAELPPTTAYTYAAELSADEALAVGAREVQFNQPVSFYVENFLSFPVGSLVPLGYYDRDKGAWKAEPDGRVIKIVGVTSNRADIAVLSSGTAASQAVLDSVGFTDAERGQLASLYSVGTELWRMPVTHFTTFDGNHAYALDQYATAANMDQDRSGNNYDPNSPCVGGSIIGCQNQTLGEVLGIAGTPYGLHYSSDRTPGFRPSRQVVIPEQPRVDTAVVRIGGNAVVRNGVSASAVGAVYILSVAGREVQEGPFLTSDPFPAKTLEWNGLDAAGRRVQGEQKATVTMSYGYREPYRVSAATGSGTTRSFGQGASSGMTSSGTVRRVRGVNRSWEVMVGNYDARAQGLGGWTLSVHHLFNPQTGILYLGDGAKRDVTAMGQTLSLAFPVGTAHPRDLAMAPDGTIYFAHPNVTVHRYTSAGVSIGRVAGLPNQAGYSGEGIRADSSRLSAPNAIAFGPDGLLYIADGNRIRRVDADGRLRTIAGTGVAPAIGSPSGEGGRADTTRIRSPRELAFLPDGSLLFVEDGMHTIRRISPNGIVSRFAGTGVGLYSGDGGPATAAQINTSYSQPATAFTTGPDGSAYLAHVEPGHHPVTVVRRIRPDGVIETIAGRRDASTGPTPARQVLLTQVRDLVVRPNGELLIAHDGRIVGVGPDGSYRVVAGTVPRCSITFCIQPQPATSGLALQVLIDEPSEMVLDQAGRLIFDDNDDDRIRAISPAMPGFDQNDILVASGDGSAAYQFDQYGRHLRTLDALTRDTVLTFGYNAAGYLTSVTDADGETTTIERSGATATAVVGPDGHRTELSYDANGYLDEVENPLGERVVLSTSSLGLLQSVTGPRGDVSAFTYDTLGRLVKDSSAANRIQTIARTQTDTSSSVAITDDLGRTRTFRLDRLSLLRERRTTTDAAGLATVSTRYEQDSTRTTAPDGTTALIVTQADSRFGAPAPVLKRAETRLPSGLTSVVTASRTATLSNAADPLSLTTLLDSVRVNSRVYRSLYTKSTRTLLTTSPMGRTTTTVYDTAGRVLRTKVPGIDSAVYAYDGDGRLTSASSGGRSSTFAYDAKGRLLSTTDPLGRKDSLFYDDADRLTRRVLPDGRAVTFAYDSSGNLTSVTPPGKPAHTFMYAPADRLAIYNPPTNGLSVSATSFGYNTAGQPTVIRRPTGDSLRFTYDGAGRPASAVFDRGTVGFTFNSTTGNLTSLSAPGSLGLAFTYDGRLPKSVTWSGTVAGSTAVTYNSDFRVTQQTVNGSNSISFGYDLDGLLTSAGALTLQRAASNGRLDADSLIIGGSTQRNAYTYDSHGALISLLAKRGNDTLFRTSYTRDSLSRITSLIERLNGVTDTVGFTYDSVGRLKAVARNGTTTASYTYDLNGNRATKVTSGGTATATVDDQDRLTSYGGASYQYTANGELRRKIVGTDTTEYTYDALGNLTQVDLPDGTEIGYLIDAQNRRIGKTVNDTLVTAWLYQGQLTPVAELDGAGNVVSRFVYATGVNVPDYLVRGDSTYRLIRDHLGSVRLVVNVASGSVAQRVRYDEFGVETENTNTGWQPFGYSGGLTDSHTGLIRFGVRDYEPTIGRWTAKDPIGFGGGTTSLYSYVGGDPINFSDPSGLCPEGMGEGMICVDFFIENMWSWGFKGDNRRHDPNAPPSRSRAQILINPNNPYAYRVLVSPSANFIYGGGPSSSNSHSLQVCEDGSFTLRFSLYDGAAPIAPDLNGSVTFTPDGKGGFTTSGTTSAFPSSDIYQRQGGAWRPIRVPHDGTSPLDLFDGLGTYSWGTYQNGGRRP
jgi:RHS repeat-associated protein